MATHEGDAKRRLRSAATQIRVLLSETEVPVRYQKEFRGLLTLIRNSSEKGYSSTARQRTFTTIRNVAAAKYIKMLLNMQYYLEAK